MENAAASVFFLLGGGLLLIIMALVATITGTFVSVIASVTDDEGDD